MPDENPFDGPQLQDGEFARADMRNTRFDGVNLAGAYFFAVLTDARFTDTNLARADFDDVNLSGARLHNINLSEASFDNLNLSNCAITNANLEGMTIDGVLVSDLFAAWKASRSHGS